ncbi:MAG: DUF2934 domain-containing protein [Microscillaceae bacterium]|nr:DUF2934 domain-containing protein [Microscillaceae bacterium]
MTDIILCFGGDCPLRKNCFRYTAEILGRQDFFGSPPFDEAKQSCTYWWSNEAQIRAMAYLIWLEAGKPEGRALLHWLEAKEKVLTLRKN